MNTFHTLDTKLELISEGISIDLITSDGTYTGTGAYTPPTIPYPAVVQQPTITFNTIDNVGLSEIELQKLKCRVSELQDVLIGLFKNGDIASASFLRIVVEMRKIEKILLGISED